MNLIAGRLRAKMAYATLLFTIILSSALCFGATEKKPGRLEAARLNNIGVALMNQQLMEKAVLKFDDALKADPSLSTAELNKGIALLNLQKLQDAERALKNAEKAQPDNPRVYYNLGLLYRSLGNNDEGIADFKKVISMDSTDPDAYYLLGSLYLQMQQYEPAVEAFQSAIKINPLHASAEFGLARALQRSGKADEARVHLKIFEHLTREKISTPMTLAYGEQGRLSTAIDVHTTEPAVGPMIPVVFKPTVILEAKDSAAATQGPGLCMIDLNGDGKADIIVATENGLRILLNHGRGNFKPADPSTFGLTLTGKTVSCAAGDYDNDERPDLAVALSDGVVLFRNVSNGKFEDVTKKVGIESLNSPTGLTFVDYDHDGDLDLIVTGHPRKDLTAATIVWRNNGNGTFTDSTALTGLGTPGATVQAVLSDLNNDRAVDILMTGQSAPTFFANQREGKFKASPLYEAQLPPTVGVAILDFNKDGWMDVALTHAGSPGITLWKNVDGKHFERVPLPLEGTTRGWGVTAIDADNDGWIDLAATVETAAGTEIHLLRNLGPAGFVDVTKTVGLDKVSLREARALVSSDIDRDGAADLMVTTAAGGAVLLHNQGGNKNHSLRISLAGLADSKSGFGTKIEVFSDGSWQKWELAGSSGYLGQGENEILAGLGSNTTVDILRMLWPTGVLQDETELAIDKPAFFNELDRRGSSCPTLFAWDGTKYQFISDVIGAAVVGHWISPTEKNLADPDEWTKIDGSQLIEKDGSFSLRFGEPMEEVNFVDQVRLISVDHPANTEVYPDERFLSAPPFPDGRPIISAASHPPLGAWDTTGRDVLALVSKHDHQYVRDFQNINFAGYANNHSLTLDLGKWTTANPLRMFLHGFIEYFTATSMYAAWQAGIDPIAPFVEAQMPDGSWKRVIDDMGFPAGLPRTIVVDLTGKLPAGVRKIRISTNLQIFWDQVQIDNGPDSIRPRVTELPLKHSSLEFRGYPRQIDGKVPGDLTYRYDQVSQTGPFARQRGTYTRYGEVTPLLKDVDDHYVIFGSGEDVDLEFAASDLPSLPKGWKRDYFFYANGFVKDMDFYEASPFTVADLPFHKMTKYPYSSAEHFPDDPETVEYLLDWNDRFDSGKGSVGYQFDYKSRRQ